jgi:hypothetical protein
MSSTMSPALAMAHARSKSLSDGDGFGAAGLRVTELSDPLGSAAVPSGIDVVVEDSAVRRGRTVVAFDPPSPMAVADGLATTGLEVGLIATEGVGGADGLGVAAIVAA